MGSSCLDIVLCATLPIYDSTMSLRTGFRDRVSCPTWLLDCHDAVVIPLAKGRQTNPIYIARPSRSQLYIEPWVRDYEDALTAVGFELGRLGKDLFLSAQVRMADSVTGWINIWRGADLDESGTMLCALMYRQDYRQCCLCGSCQGAWIRDGWMCHLLTWGV